MHAMILCVLFEMRRVLSLKVTLAFGSPPENCRFLGGCHLISENVSGETNVFSARCMEKRVGKVPETAETSGNP